MNEYEDVDQIIFAQARNNTIIEVVSMKKANVQSYISPQTSSPPPPHLPSSSHQATRQVKLVKAGEVTTVPHEEGDARWLRLKCRYKQISWVFNHLSFPVQALPR